MRYSRIEALHSIGNYSKQIADYILANMSLRTVKRIKVNISENGNITRELELVNLKNYLKLTQASHKN